MHCDSFCSQLVVSIALSPSNWKNHEVEHETNILDKHGLQCQHGMRSKRLSIWQTDRQTNGNTYTHTTVCRAFRSGRSCKYCETSGKLELEITIVEFRLNGQTDGCHDSVTSAVWNEGPTEFDTGPTRCVLVVQRQRILVDSADICVNEIRQRTSPPPPR